MSENLNLKTITTIDPSPFKHLCVTIGELPSTFLESMSYYECLAWLVSYLENTVIPAVNQNGEACAELQAAFVELKDFVDNYFDNLDVQEEINNKLDDMAEEGTLQEIITTYIQSNVAWTFDTVADMKLATNLVAGSYARTLGYRSINDGGGALYYITDSGTANERDVIAIDTLYANICPQSFITPEMFGAYGDSIHDDTETLQYCIDYASTNNLKLQLIHLYLISPSQVPASYPTYNVSLYIKSHLYIQGQGNSTGLIIDDTNYSKYWSVFFFTTGVEVIEDVVMKDFKIHQNASNLSTMGVSQKNPRFIIDLEFPLKDIVIDNILFDDVYSTDCIIISNPNAKNITITNCEFRFKNILASVASYDCSIVYLRCIDYVFNNNKLHGDGYKCVGGAELHGYNGIAKNNVIEEFIDCINVAPNFDQKANIVIESNTLHGYDGVVLWDNKDTGSTTGIYDVKIVNNTIYIEADGGDNKIGGVRTTDSSFIHNVENLYIIGNFIEFVNYDSTQSFSAPWAGGVVLNRDIDFKNIIISKNIILGSPSGGIKIGTTSSATEPYMVDIIISHNIIKNSGLKSGLNAGYASSILISNKYVKNILIEQNILDNDMVGAGSTNAFTNTGILVAGYRNYFRNNIITTVNDGLMQINDANHVFILQNDSQIPIFSPNGTKYFIKVANDGTLSTSS